MLWYEMTVRRLKKRMKEDVIVVWYENRTNEQRRESKRILGDTVCRMAEKC